MAIGPAVGKPSASNGYPLGVAHYDQLTLWGVFGLINGIYIIQYVFCLLLGINFGKPRGPYVLESLVQIVLRRGLWGDDVVRFWGQAIKHKQNTVKAYNNRGLAYHDLKQYELAIKDYSQAIQLDSGYVAAYNNRGNSYYEMANFQEALKDFNQSLQLKPDYSKAHLNRGLAFYQMDKNIQACTEFQKACDLGECDGLKWALKNEMCTSTPLTAERNDS